MTSSLTFYQVLDEMEAMHDRKNEDYGTDADPFANVRSSQEFGVEPWVGALVRANDKMKRLQKAANGEALANESIEDSLMDLAVYAAIALCLYRENDPFPPDDEAPALTNADVINFPPMQPAAVTSVGLFDNDGTLLGTAPTQHWIEADLVGEYADARHHYAEPEVAAAPADPDWSFYDEPNLYGDRPPLPIFDEELPTSGLLVWLFDA